MRPKNSKDYITNSSLHILPNLRFRDYKIPDEILRAIGENYRREKVIEKEFKEKIRKEMEEKKAKYLEENKDEYLKNEKLPKNKEKSLLEIKGGPIDSILRVLGATIICTYDKNIVKEVGVQNDIFHDNDSTAHSIYLQVCDINNPTLENIEFGVVQMLEQDSSIIAHATSHRTKKIENVYDYTLRESMIDAGIGCTLDKGSPCKIGSIFFYGHQTDSPVVPTSVVRAGGSLRFFILDTPSIKCISSITKKTLMDNQKKGVDIFATERSHFTGQKLKGMSAAEFKVDDKDSEYYCSSDKVQIGAHYTFLDMIVARRSGTSTWEEVSDKAIRWKANMVCTAENGAHTSKDEVVRETDVSEVTLVPLDINAIMYSEIAIDYTHRLMQVLRPETGIKCDGSPTGHHEELLQIKEISYPYFNESFLELLHNFSSSNNIDNVTHQDI
jgi:hypothetical protein